MKDILHNPSIQYSKEVYPNSKERARLCSLKNWNLLIITYIMQVSLILLYDVVLSLVRVKAHVHV